jgi:hypothetical protein
VTVTVTNEEIEIFHAEVADISRCATDNVRDQELSFASRRRGTYRVRLTDDQGMRLVCLADVALMQAVKSVH